MMNTLKPKILMLLALLLCVTQTWAAIDPPARVGRISYLEGEVSFSDLSSNDSGPAVLNWPVTSNTMISTANNSRAELRVGSSAIQIDADSELEVSQLDDQHLIVRLNRGTAVASVRSGEQAQGFEFDTPQGRVLLSDAARFRVDAGYAPDSSSVSVLSGRVRFEGDNSTLTVAAGRRAEIAGGEISMAGMRDEAGGDDFDAWSVARNQRSERSASARYVSPETTGYEDLDHYGEWQVTTEYGALWYPRSVPAGWAPYRAGRWTWIEPWGWTWVDSAPWGYAPSHYGRWVMYRERWCWSPGSVAVRPVWAPALVGWVGGNHWSGSISISTAPSVGWFPLAPREVYVPSYRVSPSYVRQLNIASVRTIADIDHVNRAPSHTHYRNQALKQAVTVMPSDSFRMKSAVIVTPAFSHRSHSDRWQNAPSSALVPSIIRQRPRRTESTAEVRSQQTWMRSTPTVSPSLRPLPRNVERSAPFNMRTEEQRRAFEHPRQPRREPHNTPMQIQEHTDFYAPRPVQNVTQPAGLIAPARIRERRNMEPALNRSRQDRPAPSGNAALAVPRASAPETTHGRENRGHQREHWQYPNR